MRRVAVLGAGAFGTALAATLATAGPVALWGRRGVFLLPPGVAAADRTLRPGDVDLGLVAVPMQALAAFLREWGAALNGLPLVACCKGIDAATGLGPVGTIAAACPGAMPAVLTGPGFAADLARGLPTAMTLACADGGVGVALQRRLSTRALRLYTTTDTRGAELGGALKNVVALACGVAAGAGLGASAQAAVLTRGFAEMVRIAVVLGADPATLTGLSGLGDLVLTATSAQSRNFRHGAALGRGTEPEGGTVEGLATARAADTLARANRIDAPLTATVARLTAGAITLDEAIRSLMSRPLKPE